MQCTTTINENHVNVVEIQNQNLNCPSSTNTTVLYRTVNMVWRCHSLYCVGADNEVQPAAERATLSAYLFIQCDVLINTTMRNPFIDDPPPPHCILHKSTTLYNRSNTINSLSFQRIHNSLLLKTHFSQLQ